MERLAALCAMQGKEEDSANAITFKESAELGQIGAEGLRLPIKCFDLPGCAFHSLVLE